MTRTEIEDQIRTLPDDEKVAIVDRLLHELPEAMRSELIARLVAGRSPEELAPILAGLGSEVAEGVARRHGWGTTLREPEDEQTLRLRVEAEMESWFDGPAEAMTEDDWKQILSGERTEEELDRPLGLAVPPEWTGRTLRELRDARRRS